MKKCILFLFLISLSIFGYGQKLKETTPTKDPDVLMRDANYAEALEIYKSRTQSEQISKADMSQALVCFQRLNQNSESDKFFDEIYQNHSNNWKIIWYVAQARSTQPHYGYILDGKFYRGSGNYGGRYVNSYARDRIAVLQLMEKARALMPSSAEKKVQYDFYQNFANYIFNQASWRLQYLTDISILPDYDDGYQYGNQNSMGAPVDSHGKIVLYKIPESFESSQNDGERWRWLLHQQSIVAPDQKHLVEIVYADFLASQFGVQTLNNNYNNQNTNSFDLRRLKDNQTIARLATGIQKIDLPKEAQYIKIYKRNISKSLDAARRLATIYQQRQQYKRAAKQWEYCIEKYKTGQQQYQQIIGNWGKFETASEFSVSNQNKIGFIFRNASQVKFTTQKIEVNKLLASIKDYLRSNPRDLDWSKINSLGNLGYELTQKNHDKFVSKEKVEWEVNLKPAANHFDKKAEVKLPMKAAGAYWLTAQVGDGNTCSIIVWINDTVIVSKKMKDQAYFYLADAFTGEPHNKVKVDFFGYKTIYRKKSKKRRYDVGIKEYNRFSNTNGQVIVSKDQYERDYNWLVTAQNGSNNVAFLGFQSIWWPNNYDSNRLDEKYYLITDRPVYRPNQPVDFKIWLQAVSYQEKAGAYANKKVIVRIKDPQYKTVLEKTFKTDELGGLSGVYLLPELAPLGQYSVQVRGRNCGNFRVEEYKKPEFEVKVEMLGKDLMLGDTIPITISADYYYGQPVKNATVKYKVERTNYEENWYPPMAWDWLYGRGYWWFCYDYTWYPSWHNWGISAPYWSWRPRPYNPPELVAQGQVEIGEDGKYELKIDTSMTKKLHANYDQKYNLTVEVTDQSRRTITGTKTVLLAKEPFKVYLWLEKGYYSVKDQIKVHVNAHNIENKAISGKGKLILYKIKYKNGKPSETLVKKWKVDTYQDGTGTFSIYGAKAGQYRLSYKLKDSKGNSAEVGYVFSIFGAKVKGRQYRFNQIELIPEKKEYKVGSTVKLRINTKKANATVVLFIKPKDGIVPLPKVIEMEGKSKLIEIKVEQKDMPNFYVEAFTINNGKIYSDLREIAIPPENKILKVEIDPSSQTYKPGEEATFKIKLKDPKGEPFVGEAVITIYDKSVEYISGGSNVPDICKFFWDWKNNCNSYSMTSFEKLSNCRFDGQGMRPLDQISNNYIGHQQLGTYSSSPRMSKSLSLSNMKAEGLSSGIMHESLNDKLAEDSVASDAGGSAGGNQPIQVRKNFADTVYWNAKVKIDSNGEAIIKCPMAENLTAWKVKVWALGAGTTVGQAETEVVTSKDFLIRMQTPRFLVEKDQVVLSANVHNYLNTNKSVEVELALDVTHLKALDSLKRKIEVPAMGEVRVDWKVKALKEGETTVTMQAKGSDVADAMQMSFPVLVHGMLKTESFCGQINLAGSNTIFKFDVPDQRRTEETKFELNFTPSLAAELVDALPYLADYPYGCTEQTLSRFLPSVMVQNILKEMKIELSPTKPNPRYAKNPVFSNKTIDEMVQKGLTRLDTMQLSDGGWGWFSGYGEHSMPHTTAYVVHGLQTAVKNGLKVDPNTHRRGVDWLAKYQRQEVEKIKNYGKTNLVVKGLTKRYIKKSKADNIDALVYMVLADAGIDNKEMGEFLYRDRKNLSAYGLSLYGLGLDQNRHIEKRDMIIRNLSQYIERDSENQTAYLNLRGFGGIWRWWCWYESVYEAQAYYLKLLVKTNPKSDDAAGLVKYLLNNRRNANYWNSTRDTAICIEAIAEYIKASGESQVSQKIEVYLDGQKVKEVEVNKDNLFDFDGKLILSGKGLKSGEHTVELRKQGEGRLYYNAYLTYFSLEDFIDKAGLEIKIERKYYKLNQVDKNVKVQGSRGQIVDQKGEKFVREPIQDLTKVKSGDLVEIELIIDSKNDYEYIIIEDMKAAGFEPVEVKSGYNGNSLGAYVEYRDEKVAFFVNDLARGKYSVKYKLRAEIPGKFSALPAKISAMYAPELKGNSNEKKLTVVE